ncbi:MAG: amidohydrolase family protein [Actinomycetota bacterium]
MPPEPTALIPPLLRHLHSDEFAPPRWRPVDERAAVRVAGRTRRAAPRLGLGAGTYLESRLGTAATLRAIDAEAGGGFYAVPAEAEEDREAAAATFGADGVVVDVQTHLVRPRLAAGPAGDALGHFLRAVDPDRWGGGIDPELLGAATWAADVFGGSETAVALLTSPPGRAHENVLTNEDIVAVRDVVDRYAGTGRVLTHTIVHPNLGAAERDAMAEWSDTLQPAGWKVYTLWEPPEDRGRGGWFLDDDETGGPFLESVRASGRTIVCAHKGLGGPIASLAPAGASPRDVGPAAAAFPDLTFVVYHSGYEQPGARDDLADPSGGVGRLADSLRGAGVPPGANVYGELGSTWFLVARRPEEAAHVIGTLLRCVGEDRILWGTDSVWYGAPQALIDAFRVFTIPEWMQERYGYPALTERAKRKILGANAAALYGIDLDRVRRSGDPAWLEAARTELAARLP